MSPARRGGAPNPRPPRSDPAIAVVSPFADEDDVRTSPSWRERLRGLLGMSVLVIVSGIVLAVLVAVVLLLMAIFVATTFN